MNQSRPCLERRGVGSDGWRAGPAVLIRLAEADAVARTLMLTVAGASSVILIAKSVL